MWHPIESAPRDGTQILVATWSLHETPDGPYPDFTVVYWDVEDVGGEGGWLDTVYDQALDGSPTHWMKIPPVLRFTCGSCDRMFATKEAKERHRLDVHQPHRKLSAKERPADRGDVSCGICDRSFANEWNAIQHRRNSHGIEAPALADRAAHPMCKRG